jgi:hypothetical protein
LSVQPTKICPICGTENLAQAKFCQECGGALGNIQASNSPAKGQADHDHGRFGGSDLVERELPWVRGNIIVVGVALLLIGVVSYILWINSPLANVPLTPEASITTSPTLIDVVATPSASPSPRPNLFLPTVTPAPPTVTVTPTLGPCEIAVTTGDSLISIIGRCGHRDLDVIAEVLELNELSDTSVLQVGQVIQVPRPTATVDPNITPTGTPEGAADNSAVVNLLFAAGADGVPTLTPSPSPTLLPGIQWYNVQEGDDIILVALRFGANLEVLSQLNPEITFSQCDFSSGSGGENCQVQLFTGQQMRVPAPTPTPTIQPTASGSETPTPTATATYNAPQLLSPGDRTFFRRTDLITLRWVATGTLAADEVYRIRLTEVESEQTHFLDTRDTFVIVPATLQGEAGRRREFSWQVSIIEEENPETARFLTDSRRFTWEDIPLTATPQE